MLDRARADPARLGQLAHLQQAVLAHAMNDPCAPRRRARDGAGLLQRRDLLVAVAERRAAPRRCARRAPGPGAVRIAPGVRLSFTGHAEQPHRPRRPGWSSSTTISRARTSSESSASSRSSTGSRQQSCSEANSRHSSRVRSQEDALDLRVGVRARARRTASRSGPRGRRRGTTPARTSARARRASPSRRCRRRAGSRRAARPARGRRAAGRRRRAK